MTLKIAILVVPSAYNGLFIEALANYLLFISKHNYKCLLLFSGSKFMF